MYKYKHISYPLFKWNYDFLKPINFTIQFRRSYWTCGCEVCAFYMRSTPLRSLLWGDRGKWTFCFKNNWRNKTSLWRIWLLWTCDTINLLVGDLPCFQIEHDQFYFAASTKEMLSCLLALTLDNWYVCLYVIQLFRIDNEYQNFKFNYFDFLFRRFLKGSHFHLWSSFICQMTIESLIRFNYVVELALNWEYGISKHILLKKKNMGWV